MVLAVYPIVSAEEGQLNTAQTHEINAPLYIPSTGISFPYKSTFLRTLNAANTLTTRIHIVESTK